MKEILRGPRHELRTPITHIIGYSELLLEVTEDDQQAAIIPDLQKIHRSGLALLSLVNDSLDPARLAAGGPRTR